MSNSFINDLKLYISPRKDALHCIFLTFRSSVSGAKMSLSYKVSLFVAGVTTFPLYANVD